MEPSKAEWRLETMEVKIANKRNTPIIRSSEFQSKSWDS